MIEKILFKNNPFFCLEIGCGSGYVITSLALIIGHEPNIGTNFLATDINPHAIAVTYEIEDSTLLNDDNSKHLLIKQIN